MNKMPELASEPDFTPQVLSRKPYESPELLEWGSIQELTAGPLFDTSDADFGGSGGG